MFFLLYILEYHDLDMKNQDLLSILKPFDVIAIMLLALVRP